MTRVPLYDYPRAELAELLASWGFAAHAGRLWAYLYRERAHSFEQMGELPARLRSRLQAEARLTSPSAAQQWESSDGLNTKYLLALEDGWRIESVRMHCRDRVTACLSTQVGCPLGCVFCATGQSGFERNLATGEMVAQALFIQRTLRPNDPSPLLRNIVLMGMGEPLLNYDAVMRAIRILGDPGGLAIAAKRITLSTVGVVPGIIRLADEAQACSLAVSLHAATQEERAAILPVARTWPLDALIDACRYYANQTGRKIFFEWTFIDGENDAAANARALAHLLSGIPAQVNLIPLNPTSGYSGRPGKSEEIERFQAILQASGVPTTVRRRRGIDIAAGCGQLDAAAAV